MQRQQTYLFWIVGLLAIMIGVTLVFLGAHPSHKKYATPHKIRLIKKHHTARSAALLRSLLQKKMLLLEKLTSKPFLNSRDIQSLLIKYMNMGARHPHLKMPISGENLDWIASLPHSHAIGILRMLGESSFHEWRDEIFSLRLMAPYERARAIMVGRHRGCSSEECLND